MTRADMASGARQAWRMLRRERYHAVVRCESLGGRHGTAQATGHQGACVRLRQEMAMEFGITADHVAIRWIVKAEQHLGGRP